MTGKDDHGVVHGKHADLLLLVLGILTILLILHIVAAESGSNRSKPFCMRIVLPPNEL